jgi:hypothetical protein
MTSIVTSLGVLTLAIGAIQAAKSKGRWRR